MPRVDRGELLADSNFLAYRNTRGRKYQLFLSLRTPRRLGKVPDEELGIQLVVTTPSTSSEVAAEQETLAKRKHNNLFK